VITPSTSATPFRYRASPFYPVLDLYDVRRVPWADSHALREVDAFRFDSRIPGGVVVPAYETAP
jgi:hypothetical protein